MVAGDLTPKKVFILSLVFIVAIMIRLMMGMHYFDISGDKIYQTAAAWNISEGKGYTVPVVDPLHLDSSYDKAMILWPPLYSASLAILVQVTRDAALSSFMLDSINNIIFLGLIFWICSLLNFPFLVTLLILLFKATEINDIIFASTPTDYMALNFWLATIICGIQYLATNKNGYLAGFVLLNALGPWIRYSNIPIVPVLPVLLLLAGAWKREKKWMRNGLVACFAAIGSTAMLLYFNHSRSGEFFYVLETTKGFFPENLKHLPPIVWMSMVNVNFPLTQVSLRTDISYGTLNNWLKISNALLIAVLLWHIISSIMQSGFKQRNIIVKYFYLFTAALSVGTLGSLAWLSISRSRNFQVDQFWTYIEEHRYMLIVTISLMFYLINEFIVEKKNKVIGYLLLLIMIAETAHGIWVVAKGPFVPINKSSLLFGTPQTKKLIEECQLAAAKENTELILIDEDYNLRGYAILNHISIIDDPYDLDKASFRSASGKKLVFRMRPGHESLYKSFMSQKGVHEIGRVEQAVFYELNIPGDSSFMNN